MARWGIRGLVVAGWLACAPVFAQTHKVTKPENVVRAVGVYEWTGELTKAKSSRLVPVTLFIDGKLQDAGVYMARPVPFALYTGTVFELDLAGVPKGTVQLSFARHLLAVNPKGEARPYEDGWFGYGVYQPIPVTKPKLTTKVRQSNASLAVNGAVPSSSQSDDPDRPVLIRKGDISGAGSASDDSAAGNPAADPDRPTMRRRSGDDASSGASPAPPDDPDRPVLKKKTGSDRAAADTDPGPAADPDRPTLKKKRSAAADESNGAGGDPALNADPNRPTLHRGKPVAAMTEEDIPKLTGLPPDLHQMVAVSDAANRPVHNFARAWESDAERESVRSKMQELARAKVLAYSGLAPAAKAAAKTAPAMTPAAKRKAEAAAKAAADAAQASVVFADEDLRGYLLSYGGMPTYVYTATAGADKNGAVRYVWVVAQADGLGELKAAMGSVTDALHLDRAPRMRLVDAVDVEASNRASLLVELRAQSSRQFALYRVIGAQAEAIFTTGTTQ